MKVLFHIMEQFEFYSVIYKHVNFYAVESFIVLMLAFFFMHFYIKGNNIISYILSKFLSALSNNFKTKFKNEDFFYPKLFIFCVIFLFVFLKNLTSMVPEVLTVTAFINLPLFLSVVSFITSIIIIVSQNNFVFLLGFLPSKNSTIIDPILFLIEILSFTIRLFSLATRLFINMLAGHILSKFISIVFLFLVNFLNTTIAIEVIVCVLNILLVALELLACFLQSIIMVSLIIIYFDQAIYFKPH